MPIRILSWNVCDENTRSAADIAQCILIQNADVVCLQEVTAKIWKDLWPLLSQVYEYYHAAHDMHREGQEPCMLAFLSRLPIVRARAIKSRAKKGWFKRFRSFFSFFSRIKEEHMEFQKVDIKTQKGRLRIMNAHLEVGTSPCNRLNQFKYVLRRCKRRGHIKNAFVVGDFNVFGEEFLVRFIGIFSHGFGIKWIGLNEREEFTKLCEKRGLKNIFEGYPTLFRAGYAFQLDHILVPNHASVVFKNALFDMYDCSDHKQIIADIEII